MPLDLSFAVEDHGLGAGRTDIDADHVGMPTMKATNIIAQ